MILKFVTEIPSVAIDYSGLTLSQINRSLQRAKLSISPINKFNKVDFKMLSVGNSLITYLGIPSHLLFLCNPQFHRKSHTRLTENERLTKHDCHYYI